MTEPNIPGIQPLLASVGKRPGPSGPANCINPQSGHGTAGWRPQTYAGDVSLQERSRNLTWNSSKGLVCRTPGAAQFARPSSRRVQQMPPIARDSSEIRA
jgi:hypothetical protein